jgi:branched-chain amino acid transport system substrate-binding protein
MSLVLSVTLWLTACQSSAPSFQCTDKIGCVTIRSDEPIKIGAIHVLSGELEPLGREQVQSIEIALADRGNQLLGHPLQLQSEDDGCSREGGTTAAQKIVTDPQIVAILGTTCSGAAIPAAKIMSEAGLVMISGSNTAPSLTSVEGKQGSDWQPGYFRTAHNDATQGRAAAVFAFQELGVKKAATINDGDAYTRGLTGVFNQVFTELGGEIVLDGSINKGDMDMKPVLEAVAASEAELLFFPIFPPEGNFIVLQAKEVERFKDIKLMSADGTLVGPFVEAVGAAGEGMYFVAPATPIGAAYDDFAAKYKSKYGETPGTTPYSPHTYDAANMLFKAIETVAVQDVRGDGTLHLGRQALRDALYATPNFQGLTGRLTCDKFGDCGVASFKVVRLDDPAAGIEGLTNNVIYTYTPGQQAKGE